MRTFLVIWIFNLLSSKDVLGAFTTTHASNIHTAILGTSYNKYVRPSEVTGISVSFTLISLNDLDMKSQVMTTSGWLTVTWSDPRLTWTASSYGNIEYIYTKQDKIWRPELIIDNSVEGMDPIGNSEVFFKIKNTGDVTWDPPGRYDTHCDIDVTNYPFDYQTCSIEITSGVFTTSVLTLNKSRETVNFEDYKENGEWTPHSSRVEEKTLQEYGETYSQLEFVLVFKRRSSYYLSNVIYPIILLSLLTNLIFLLPLDSGEKIGYILTVLLALAVLLTIIGDSMPTTSKHTSVLGLYISFVLLMAGLGIVLTIFNLRLYLKPDQSDVPKWLQCFTVKVLLRFNCRSGKVENNEKVQAISKGDNLALQDVDGEQQSNTRLFTSTSKSQANQDPEFTHECKDVAVFLDSFFFWLFNIITFVLSIVFFTILAVSGEASS